MLRVFQDGEALLEDCETGSERVGGEVCGVDDAEGFAGGVVVCCGEPVWRRRHFCLKNDLRINFENGGPCGCIRRWIVVGWKRWEENEIDRLWVQQ